MSAHVQARVSMTIDGVAVATATVSLPSPAGIETLTDEQLAGFVRQAAMKLLPSVAVIDPKWLRSVLTKSSDS